MFGICIRYYHERIVFDDVTLGDFAERLEDLLQLVRIDVVRKVSDEQFGRHLRQRMRNRNIV